MTVAEEPKEAPEVWGGRQGWPPKDPTVRGCHRAAPSPAGDPRGPHWLREPVAESG